MIHESLSALATQRIVVFVGLPATGKSLLVRELARLAQSDGREVSLLQWDVARPTFEAHPAAAPYPMLDSITRPVIRRAVGLWSREAIAGWSANARPEALLVVEAPLVGWRLVELVQQADDAAEAALTSEACRFVLPVPSADVQRHILAERLRKAASPANAGEREEAPPTVLDAMWRLLVEARQALGVFGSAAASAYDAAVYGAVYGRLARHRRFEALPVDEVIDARGSAYEFDFPAQLLLPDGAAIERFIALAAAEAAGRDEDAWLARWWDV